ncbi:MAG: hypothetical protein HFH14_03880 [Lachnospiraceae bacterium]|nr:hypothetical protein [Lachnospiraceae bacterium]
MNSAKRVSNQTIKNNDKKSKNTAPAESAGKKNVIILSVVGIVLLLVISVVLWENLHPRLIFTVNGTKVYLGDMMTDIYMSESTGQYMDNLYKQNYGSGSSYWDAENNDGMTYGDILKDNTLEASMQREMMYKEAVEAGYTLTDEENTTCEENTTSLYDQLSSSVKNKSGLNRKKILQYYKKKTLADRYKADWIDSFEINDEALIAEAGITKEDYRQYDIQYYYIPYTETDDQGNETPVSDDKKAEALKELEASYGDIAGLADFTTYIDDGTAHNHEEGTENAAEQTEAPAEDAGPKAPEGTNIKYTTKSFIEKDEPVFSAELTAQVKAMENGTVTEGVVEDENGCYIIKMVENNSTEKYDSECESVVTEKENEEFQTKIDELEVDKYLIEVNDKEWDKVTFGSVTIN